MRNPRKEEGWMPPRPNQDSRADRRRISKRPKDNTSCSLRMGPHRTLPVAGPHRTATAERIEVAAVVVVDVAMDAVIPVATGGIGGQRHAGPVPRQKILLRRFLLFLLPLLLLALTNQAEPSRSDRQPAISLYCFRENPFPNIGVWRRLRRRFRNGAPKSTRVNPQ